MHTVPRATVVLSVACVAALACSKAVSGPSRDELVAQLRQQAQQLKIEGEKIDPALPVKSTWEMVAVDVREQQGNERFPYKGTVRFKIVSVTQGSLAPDEFEKTFDYVYDAEQKKWR